jgi:hypothetical protein
LLSPRVRQQLLRLFDRRRNIAAAENGGIGKSVDEIDDQQAIGARKPNDAPKPCR